MNRKIKNMEKLLANIENNALATKAWVSSRQTARKALDTNKIKASLEVMRALKNVLYFCPNGLLHTEDCDCPVCAIFDETAP